jgi:hypothetical protein
LERLRGDKLLSDLRLSFASGRNDVVRTNHEPNLALIYGCSLLCYLIIFTFLFNFNCHLAGIVICFENSRLDHFCGGTFHHLLVLCWVCFWIRAVCEKHWMCKMVDPFFPMSYCLDWCTFFVTYS